MFRLGTRVSVPLRRGLMDSKLSLSLPLRSFAVLSRETINPNILRAEYAVRGPLVTRSMEYQARLDRGDTSLPFDRIISCNIGNPQQLGQPPLAFHRHVLALVNVPGLMDAPEAKTLFAPDVIARAQRYVDNIPGGTGAYCHSKGVEIVRKEVAEFLERRDGFPADPECIFLTDGASAAVHTCIKTLIRDERDAIIAPIPQYPLYSAAIALNGGTLIGYYLREEDAWKMEEQELERAINEARRDGKNVRAIVVINPGNPTGACLSIENLHMILKFCQRNNLVVLADEVYQENIFNPSKKFISMRRALHELGPKYQDVELIHYHSVSKGFTGECGRRGGFMELINIRDEVCDEIYKLMSINLCSNIEGQLMVGLMVNPPKEGEASYPLYQQQRDATCAALKRRAAKLVASYRELEGVSCNETEGSLYTFPRITVPPKACEEAKRRGMQPDEFYCSELLDHTGIVVVPGSGFEQEPGTWHFRSTILPPEEAVDDVIAKTAEFHRAFMDKYREVVHVEASSV